MKLRKIKEKKKERKVVVFGIQINLSMFKVKI